MARRLKAFRHVFSHPSEPDHPDLHIDLPLEAKPTQETVFGKQSVLKGVSLPFSREGMHHIPGVTATFSAEWETDTFQSPSHPPLNPALFRPATTYGQRLNSFQIISVW
jgi:hypothetical protein